MVNFICENVNVVCPKITSFLQEIFVRRSQLVGIDVVTSHVPGFRNCKNHAIRDVFFGNDTIHAVDLNDVGLCGNQKNVALAYIRGIYIFVIVSWLKEHYGCEVVCFITDVGQSIKELEGLEQNAKTSVASQLVVKDLTEVFMKEYIYSCLGADVVAHGCIGKKNEVWFKLIFFSLNPKFKDVAPWREWEIQGREDVIEYAKNHNIHVPVTVKSIYSIDINMEHLSHEIDILEYLANAPKKDMYMMSVDPKDVPNQPEYIERIEFGLPVALNENAFSPARLLAERWY